MKMSTKGRYALTIMTYLAKEYDSSKYVSLKEIADKEKLSSKYLEKIMLSLKSNDYFDILRGNNGGYKLKYDPSKYKVGEILRNVEGDLSPVECNKECDKKESCTTYPFWQGLSDEINSYVDNKNLSDLIGRN